MKPGSSPPPRSSERAAFRAGLLVALALLGSSALGLETVVSRLRLQLRKEAIHPASGLKLHSLPKEFPGWRGVRDEIMSAESAAELGTDNYVTREYHRIDPVGRPTEPPARLQLHAAYYTGMIDTVPHVPERCLIGGGMEYAGESRVVDVPLDLSRLVPDPDDTPRADRPRLLTARNDRTPVRVRLPRGIEHLQMMITPFRDAEGRMTLWAGYFFMANGGVVASANDVRLLAFKPQEKYAYYTKIQFLTGDVDSAEALASLAASVLDEMFPDLMRCVPDWTDVEEGRWPPIPAAGESTGH